MIEYKDLTMHGVDVSHWQSPVDWNAYRADGGEFVIIKFGGANTGEMYVSDSMKIHHQAARDAGMKIGYYWVVNGHLNALDQAKFFVDNIKDIIQPGEIVALDNEALDKGTFFNAEQSLMWLIYVQEKLNVTPFFYSYPSLIKSIDWGDIPSRFPLWLAAFNRNDGTTNGGYEKHMDQWQRIHIWQYTSNGRIEGYGSRIDQNVARPFIFDLYGHAAEEAIPTLPEPESEPEELPFPKTAIDGIAGRITWRRLQVWLKKDWGYEGAIDGIAGPLTWKAMQRFANSL